MRVSFIETSLCLSRISFADDQFLRAIDFHNHHQQTHTQTKVFLFFINIETINVLSSVNAGTASRANIS